MDITGKLLKTSEIKTFESGFQVQEFYLDCTLFNQYTGEPIKNIIKFQITGKNIEYLDTVKINDKVKVYFSIKGSFYDKKEGTSKVHIQNLNAYKVEPLETKQTPQPTAQTSQPKAEVEKEIDDDLPF